MHERAWQIEQFDTAADGARRRDDRTGLALLRRMSLEMAQSGGPGISAFAPLSGVKQTFGERVENDASDPEPTSMLKPPATYQECDQVGRRGTMPMGVNV
jgi:hypothetical protein